MVNVVNQECVEKCPYMGQGIKCLVGDPVNRTGEKSFDKFCLYFACPEARDCAKNAWAKTQWSDSSFKNCTIKPKSHEVIVSPHQEDTVLMELTPFETPRVKVAGTLPGYQMYINSDGDIFGRNHNDGKIYATGINAWTSPKLT